MKNESKQDAYGHLSMAHCIVKTLSILVIALLKSIAVVSLGL